MTRSVLLRSAALGFAVALAPGLAFGQSDADAKRGQALFVEGQAALDKGDYPAACAKFSESMKIAPRPNVVFNLAQCEEHEGRLVSAKQHWLDGQAALDSSDPRVAIAKDKAAALDKRIGSLVLRLPADTPADAHVKVDGVEIDRKSVGAPRPTDPGSHTVTLSAAGHKDATVTIALAEGGRKEQTLPLGAADPTALPAAAPPPSSSAAAPPAAPRSSTRRTAGFVVGGVGLAGFVVAGVTGGMLLANDSTIQANCKPTKTDCNGTAINAIHGDDGLFVANYVGWGVGIAGVATGAVLLLTSKGGAAPATTAFEVTPALGGASVGVKGRF